MNWRVTSSTNRLGVSEVFECDAWSMVPSGNLLHGYGKRPIERDDSPLKKWWLSMANCKNFPRRNHLIQLGRKSGHVLPFLNVTMCSWKWNTPFHQGFRKKVWKRNITSMDWQNGDYHDYVPHRSSWTGLKGGGPISEMQHVIPDPSTANFPPKKSGIESTDTGKDDLKKKNCGNWTGCDG